MAPGPGFSFGQPGPPGQPISPFGFMGAGPIGMSMQEMLASMQPRVPQIGQMLGPGAQQIMNFAFPMMQNMMMQRQLATGQIPLGFGTGPPAQQMQAFNFMQATQIALKDVQARDLKRIGAMGNVPDIAAGLMQFPVIGPILQKIFIPQGLEQDLTTGLLAATRGQMPGADVAELSKQIFAQFSRAGPGGVRRLDPALTGGLTTGQLGGVAFEINRRGGGVLFNQQIAGNLLEQQGVTLEDVGTRGRTIQIQKFQARAVGERISQVTDILGLVDDLLGGGQQVSQLLDIIRSISGKQILTPGADIGRVRQQFEQVGGLANVLGIAPQALLGMAQAQAVGLRAQGLPGQLALPLTIQQAAQISAAEANIITAPGVDITRQQLARAAATGTTEALLGVEGIRLGQLRGLQAAGAGGARLEQFFGRTAAERAGILADPARRGALFRGVRAEVQDQALFDILTSDDNAARFLQGEDIQSLQRVRAERGFETLNRILAFQLGDRDRASRITNALREGGGALTKADRIILGSAGVVQAFQAREGAVPLAFASIFNQPALQRAAGLRRAGITTGRRASLINQLLGGQGALQGLLEGEFTIESLATAVTGGAADLASVLQALSGDELAEAQGFFTRYGETVRGIVGDRPLSALSKEELQRLRETTMKFSGEIFQLSPEISKRAKEQFRTALESFAIELQEGDTKPSAEEPRKERSGLFGRALESIEDVIKGVIIDRFSGGRGGGKQPISLNITLEVPGLGTFAGDKVEMNDDGTTKVVLRPMTTVIS